MSPASVLSLTITPDYRVDGVLVRVLIGAFGAQALLAGLFAAFTRFERITFFAFGLALLPFFIFDYWAYAVVPILTPVGLLDVAGNLAMLGLCAAGYRAVA